MPSLPTPAELIRAVQAQAEAMAALPGALLSLTRAVSQLNGTLTEARAAAARLQHLGDRLDGILDEIEQPVRDMAPGLRRVGKMLDDPTVSEIPDTVRKIRDDLLPLVGTLRGTTDVLDRFSARSLLAGRRRSEPATPSILAEPAEQRVPAQPPGLPGGIPDK
jgi:ABC-type transporter Mla subunit MlaD